MVLVRSGINGIEDAGCRILDAGCRMLDAGAGCWMTDTGCRGWMFVGFTQAHAAGAMHVQDLGPGTVGWALPTANS